MSVRNRQEGPSREVEVSGKGDVKAILEKLNTLVDEEKKIRGELIRELVLAVIVIAVLGFIFESSLLAFSLLVIAGLHYLSLYNEKNKNIEYLKFAKELVDKLSRLERLLSEVEDLGPSDDLLAHFINSNKEKLEILGKLRELFSEKVDPKSVARYLKAMMVYHFYKGADNLLTAVESKITELEEFVAGGKKETESLDVEKK